MRQRVLWALSAPLLAAACGGASTSLIGSGDGGPGSDGSSGSGGGSGSGSGSGSGGSSGSSGGSDSGSGSGSSSGGDAGKEATVTCEAGATLCAGQCVDTGTDPQNCGGCSVTCNTTCTGGICPLIPADAGTPPTVGDNACLTVDSTSVYWGTGIANGSVWKVPIGGGAPSQVIGGQAAPHAMASDGTNLFYANQGTSATCTGSIQRISVNGGNNATPIASNQCNPLDVVLDATNVYWTNAGDGSVWMSDKTTPNPLNLVPASSSGHAGYLRVDQTNVYFTDPASGVLDRVLIAGGSVTAVTTAGITGEGHLAIDGTDAFFGSRGTSTSAIVNVGLSASGGSTMQTVTSLPSVNGIQTDGTHLWFAEATDVQPYQASTGEIHRVTVAGGSDTILASKQNGPNCISVDATSIYWIDTGGGMISKTGK